MRTLAHTVKGPVCSLFLRGVTMMSFFRENRNMASKYLYKDDENAHFAVCVMRDYQEMKS